MYAVAVSILFKEGKLDELKDFFENTGFPALEVLNDITSTLFRRMRDIHLRIISKEPFHHKHEQ